VKKHLCALLALVLLLASPSLAFAGPRSVARLVVSRAAHGAGSTGGGVVGSLVLSSITPALGDIYAGTPVTFTGTGLSAVNAATLGGVACTNVVAVNATTVTATAPALAAAGATYSAQLSSGAGSSNTLTNAYEAWSPTVDYPAARVFQSDRGTTSASTASRARAGIVTQSWTTITRDGAVMLELPSGRILMIGGWNTGYFPPSAYDLSGDVTNAILYSDDQGKTPFSTLLAHDSTPGTSRFLPGHTAAVFLHTATDGLLYVYWIGSDANAGAGRDGGVWRALASALDVGGTATGAWSRIATSAPTAGRSLYMFGSYGGAIYIMGGQTDLADIATAQKDVYRSTDNGVTWTRLTDAPWAVRVGNVGALPVYNGKLWVIGGAIYASTTAGRTYYNDVWTFDGTTWVQKLADGHGQWLGRHYHGLTVYKNKLWIINGFVITAGPAGGISEMISSSDGVTWTRAATYGSTTMPWEANHAMAYVTPADGSGILMTVATNDNYFWRFVEHTGPLVSGWADQGSGALSLLQAGASTLQPILDATCFGAQPGVVLTGTESMSLASIDRGITGGVYEAWVVGRTLNFNTTPHQGTVDPPSTLIGNNNAAAYNEFGMNAAALEYHEGSGGWHITARGSALSDDKPRLLGVSHATGSLKLFVGTAQQGTTDTGVGFDGTFTGWNSVGVGFGGTDDHAEFAFGAIVILKTNAASSSTFRSKLNLWAKKFGSVSN
jgi:hypothetical protein